MQEKYSKGDISITSTKVRKIKANNKLIVEYDSNLDNTSNNKSYVQLDRPNLPKI